MGALYNTFLHAMSAAVFSYLAVENFANEVISRHPDTLVNTIERPRVVRKGKKTERRLDKKISGAARDAERKSLSVKLGQILPQVTGISIDKGKAMYQQFRRLESMRDSVIHMKSTTSATRPKELDKISKQPLWDDFVHEDSLWMPDAALQIIRHFWIDTLPLEWLSDIETQIKREAVQ